MKRKLTKRIWAYLIDILVVITLSSLLTQIKALNPNYDNYNKVVNEYLSLIEESNGNIESLDAEVISNLSYKIDKYGVTYYLIDVVVICAYFTLFPLFNKNRTIGMHVMKLEIKRKKAGWSLFLRSLLIPIYTGTGFTLAFGNVLNAFTILFLKGNPYYIGKLTITFFVLGFVICDIVKLYSSQGTKSLHDIISLTEVN